MGQSLGGEPSTVQLRPTHIHQVLNCNELVGASAKFSCAHLRALRKVFPFAAQVRGDRKETFPQFPAH